MKKFKFSDVEKWYNSKPENKWRKKYKIDIKRILYFINNDTETELPPRLQRKTGITYDRELALAKEFLKDNEVKIALENLILQFQK